MIYINSIVIMFTTKHYFPYNRVFEYNFTLIFYFLPIIILGHDTTASSIIKRWVHSELACIAYFQAVIVHIINISFVSESTLAKILTVLVSYVLNNITTVSLATLCTCSTHSFAKFSVHGCLSLFREVGPRTSEMRFSVLLLRSLNNFLGGHCHT